MTSFEQTMIAQFRNYFKDTSTSHYRVAKIEFPTLTHIIESGESFVFYNSLASHRIDVIVCFCEVLTLRGGRLPQNIHNGLILGLPKENEPILIFYLSEYHKYD
jgi:hypothetical protein